MLQKATAKGMSPSQPMCDRVTSLSEYAIMITLCECLAVKNIRAWVKSAKEVQGIASRNYVKRFVNHDNDARAIAGQISKINWSIDSFTVSTPPFRVQYIPTTVAFTR